MIELKQVTKRYASGKIYFEALKGVDFAVNAGDFIVVKGPSGSGKSTLLNILGLLDSPTTGQVLLNGKPETFKDFDDLATRRSHVISFIFQSFNLNPVLTLEENVMLPLMIRPEISRREKRKRVDEWVEKVGLAPHRGHKPEELSGGQRQRVAIARAMVSQPKIVIADEPTANLDSETTKSILELMRELNREQSVSFVFATHDPILLHYAKVVKYLVDGRILADVPEEEKVLYMTL